MAKTADARTFTKVVSMRRDNAGVNEYDLLAVKKQLLLSIDADAMHWLFAGLARWFRKPPPYCWSASRRVRITIEVLPDEPETPKG